MTIHPSKRARGFSLVEVVIALGIIAVAFIGIFSMLPTGLGIFRQAMDTTIGAQIAQRLVGEAEQTDFDALVPGSGTPTNGTTTGGEGGQFYALPLRYFDDQGSEVITTDPRNLKVVYTARVRGSMPGKADASQADSTWFTSLPGTTQRFNPRASTFLTVQVFKNPGHKDITKVVDEKSYLIDATMAAKENLQVQNYSAVVARNGYHKKAP